MNFEKISVYVTNKGGIGFCHSWSVRVNDSVLSGNLKSVRKEKHWAEVFEEVYWKFCSLFKLLTSIFTNFAFLKRCVSYFFFVFSKESPADFYPMSFFFPFLFVLSSLSFIAIRKNSFFSYPWPNVNGVFLLWISKVFSFYFDIPLREDGMPEVTTNLRNFLN